MPLTGEDILLYEKRDHIVIITINRPERMNAVSLELMDRLGDAWERYRDDHESWCAILTAAGDRAFSSGRDLREVVEDGGIAKAYEGKRRHTLNSSVPTGCEGLWKPVIAAINGYAIAGGWHLAQN